MLTMLKELLRAAGADAWEITDTACEGWEFYFVGHRLDQNRCKLVRHIQLKVYKKSADGQFLGSAAEELPPTADRQEAEQLIARLLRSASFVRNPVFTLNPKAEQPEQKEKPDAAEIAAAFLDAIRRVQETPQTDINSCEIFVDVKTVHFLSSEGTDVTYTLPESTVEAVINARREGHEIELYRLYKMGTCDGESLVRDIEQVMRFGSDRLEAVPTPKLGKADVLLGTDAAQQIYGWYEDRLNAALKVQGLSDAEIGSELVKDAEGDRITLTALARIPNSSCNADYDPEGAPTRDLTLLENGVVRAFHGSRPFRCYLGAPDEGYLARNFRLQGGTASEEQLREGAYLEPVEFSDFQVNTLTGDIAGEIRLAYWHDGDTCVPVTGGSVSGNMRAAARTLRCSAEQRHYNNWVIPTWTRLAGLSVTGV